MKPSVLFVCIGNSCRSQIAEGWARKLVDFPIDIQSAGTKPATVINPLAVQVMKEVGIDIAHNKPKLLTNKMIKDTTHFISMGCGVQESCPVPLIKVQIEDWEIEDPVGKDITFYRQIREQIKVKVIEFLNRLKKEAKNI
jgi:arsenate reductase